MERMKRIRRWLAAGAALLGSGLAIGVALLCVIYITIVAILASDQPEQSAGYNLPGFITNDMMQAFFETQEQYHIPVSTGIAQLIQESGFGSYGPGGDQGQGLSRLAYEYKNLFGIKYFSGDSYANGSVDMYTWEQTAGGATTTRDAFSTYASYGDCIRQRAVMLRREPYYSRTSAYDNLCDGHYTQAQANSFMDGIRKAGWATDPQYTQSCIGHMEQYNLYQFDNMTWEQYLENQNGGNTGGDGTFQNPCPAGTVTSEFGPRNAPTAGASTYHMGRDYGAPAGTPILATSSGTVKSVQENSIRGKFVVIDHGGGIESWYQHCSAIHVSVGQTVSGGQQIASVGMTGISTGAHLHFEIHLQGTPVDPRTYLQS